MPRALWKGALAFGLVHVPVELYAAEEHKALSFSMLDKRDFSPVGFRRYSKSSGKEVPWEDVVKGYEYEKDQYVVLSDEDFRRADAKASRTIDIEAFVAAASIPPPFFETPYYLVPAAGGEKVYALLRETLKATRRVAVAQLVIRTAKHLAMVAPAGKALVLNTLRYPDELRSGSDLELPADGVTAAGITAREIALAKRLIDDMTTTWKPGDYHDTYHQDLMKRIREKIKRGQTKALKLADDADDDVAPHSAEVIDLAALLKRSLGKRPAGASASERGASSKRTAGAAAPKPAAKRAAAPSTKPSSAKRGVAAKVVARRKRA